MASCTCHVLGGTKRFRLERIVRPLLTTAAKIRACTTTSVALILNVRASVDGFIDAEFLTQKIPNYSDLITTEWLIAIIPKGLESIFWQSFKVYVPLL